MLVSELRLLVTQYKNQLSVEEPKSLFVSLLEHYLHNKAFDEDIPFTEYKEYLRSIGYSTFESEFNEPSEALKPFIPWRYNLITKTSIALTLASLFLHVFELSAINSLFDDGNDIKNAHVALELASENLNTFKILLTCDDVLITRYQANIMQSNLGLAEIYMDALFSTYENTTTLKTAYFYLILASMCLEEIIDTLTVNTYEEAQEPRSTPRLN